MAVAAAAVPIAKFIGANIASYAASQGLDYVINRGIPKALHKGRKYTYDRSKKSKFHRNAYKALTKTEKIYHGGPGQIARGFGNFIGQSVISHKTNKAMKSIFPKTPKKIPKSKNYVKYPDFKKIRRERFEKFNYYK